MSRSVVPSLLLGLLACSAPPRPEPPPAAPPPLLAIAAGSFGPLSVATPATLGPLRRALPGYEVVPLHRAGLEYRVSRGGVKVFDVIPDAAGALQSIHVVSPRIAIAGRPWRTGAPFTGIELLTTCECWGDRQVCFRDGDHVAVAFARACRDGSSSASRRSLLGLPVKLVIWSPRPFAPGGFAGKDAELDAED